MIYYSFEEFKEDVKKVASEVKNDGMVDCIVAISRGGMTFGHSLSVALRNRHLFSINSIHYDDQHKLDDIKIFNIPDLSNYKRILVVDDIIDSGETMFAVRDRILSIYPHIEFKIASIFKKEKALLKPDYFAKEANDWIDFFWDIYID